MVALIVISTVIVFLAILLLVPVRVKIYAKYENNNLISDYKIKYGFVTLKSRSDKKKNRKKKDGQDKKKEKDRKSVKNTIGFVKKNAKHIKRLVCDVTYYVTKKAVKFEKFHITARLGTDDAMDTALAYGSSSAVLYNAVGIIERNIKTKNLMIDYKPDFTRQEIFIEFESIIKTRIYNVFGLARVAILRIIPIVKDKKRNSVKGFKGDKNGKSD